MQSLIYWSAVLQCCRYLLMLPVLNAVTVPDLLMSVVLNTVLRMLSVLLSVVFGSLC